MSHAARLRDLLAQPAPVIAPGCFDALSALMIEQAGFDCAYVSGANVAFSKLGRPDLGLVGMSEMADTVGHIRDRIELPLVVDADTGFGNALNVQRTVRLFERMGADAIQLEDQAMPKKCGHFRGKKVVETGEMIGKIKAALDARLDESTIILARTDAVAVEGFDAAMARADAYIDAGADMLFVEAPRTVEQMRTITGAFGGRVPLLANMVEGGDTPLKSARDLGDLGFSLVIFPGALNRAYTFMARRFLNSLKLTGSTAGWRAHMYDLAGINEVVELGAMTELGNRYGGEDPPPLGKKPDGG